MEQILNYIKVNEYISTAGQPTKKQFKIIAKNRFDVVINLALHDSSNALKNEDKIVSKNDMIYIHIPISWETPEVDRLRLFLFTLKALQKNNKKVFIHCAMNYRVQVFMHHYKKSILNVKKLKLIMPNEFILNKVWKKLKDLDL